MVMGASVVLALINLRVAFGKAHRSPHLFFTLAALSVATISGFELALMRTTELARYESLLRLAVVPIGLMVASVTGFVWSFFGTGQKWLALLGVGLNTLSQIANLTTSVPSVRHAVTIHQSETFGGVQFTVPTIVNGWWDIVELASIAAIMMFVLDASMKLWRRGERRRALIVGGGIFFFFFAARGHAILVEKGIVQTPYLVSFAFVGVLVAMGLELSHDVLHAGQLAEKLRESERSTELAARAAALGFWTWDIARDEIWASGAARALFGFGPEERISIGRFFEVLHSEDREGVRQALDATLAGALEYEKEYRVVPSAEGARWIVARGRVEVDADKRPALIRGVVMDITSRRHSEAELQRVRGQLAHAGRVSMMGQLASALAHELNQPLGAILRNAEAAEIFLQSENPDIEELRAIVSDIRNDNKRAGDVIDRMRHLLKRRDLESCPIEMGDLLNEVTGIARADAAARRVMLEVAVISGLPPVKGDRVHLQQVLLNLVLNAMDAVNGSGEDNRRVVLRAGSNGPDGVEVSVCDNGHGIPADKFPDVFEPFFTTKSHGMGMGLAISRTIVEAHGGRIWAENNTRGSGATFRFTLPVADNGTAA